MSASIERASRSGSRAASAAADPRRLWRSTHSMPLAWRIFAANAVILVAATVALALSPATVSFPIALTEGLVLTAGLIGILAVNLLLVRRSFAPLERLVRLMRSVDLLRPGERLHVTGSAEVRELGAVFNEMLARLEQERHESGWDALTRHEAERKRVAQELHDEVGQALTAVMLQIGRLAKSAPEELEQELNEALETTRSSLDNVRRIAKQLRPEALDDLGLAPALNALVAYLAARTGLRIKHRIPETMAPLSDEAELVVYRVAQESLTNAARHAGSTRIDFTLDEVGRSLVLRVRDYGRGFERDSRGSGIRGMRERALLIGAEFSIRSPKSGGTEVMLSVPIDESR